MNIKQTCNNSIYIRGNKLVYGTSYDLTIVALQAEKCIIKGTVTTSNGIPIENAVVEAKEINPFTNKSTVLGYCFTNEDGEYIFTIEPLPELVYEITVYSPLN